MDLKHTFTVYIQKKFFIIIIDLSKCPGGDAVLVCDFKAEDEEIYSVKWYKGGR